MWCCPFGVYRGRMFRDDFYFTPQYRPCLACPLLKSSRNFKRRPISAVLFAQLADAVKQILDGRFCFCHRLLVDLNADLAMAYGLFNCLFYFSWDILAHIVGSSFGSRIGIVAIIFNVLRVK